MFKCRTCHYFANTKYSVEFHKEKQKKKKSFDFNRLTVQMSNTAGVNRNKRDFHFSLVRVL